MKPLKGKTILVTRPRERAGEFITLIEEAGGRALLVPLIRIVSAQSWERCDAAIQRLQDFDGILFTSANGARFFLGRFSVLDRNCADALATIRLYAVGGQTSTILSSYGLNVALMPHQYKSRELGEALIQEGVKGKRFLFPKGNLGGEELRDILRNAGATVEEVIVYENLAPSANAISEVDQMLKNGGVDAVTFFSPSSFQNFVGQIGAEPLLRTVVAAIGETTADTIRKVSIPVRVVAKEATSRGMLRALEEYFSYSSVHSGS